jgi:nucleoid DNA-binding protein
MDRSCYAGIQRNIRQQEGTIMPTKKRKSATKRKTKAKKTSRRKKSRTKAKSARKRKTKTRARVSPTTPLRSSYNKSQIMNHIAEVTDLSKKQVGAVFDEMSTLMHRHLRAGAAGEFTVPGLMKCVVKRKPATKSRRGINPFTGEMTTFQAKPARNVVKIRALKRLKEMVK